MKFADLHIHSKYSIELGFHLWNLKLMTIEKILERSKERNLSAIAIADHDNIEASFLAEKMAKKYGIIVIPAIEVSSKEGHILAYGVSKNIKAKMSALKTIEEIHNQGGIAVAAHPYLPQGLNNFFSFKKRQYLKILPVDGVEVISCATSSFQAKKIAKILNLAVVGGSDAHCLSAIGYGLTAFPDNCKTVDGYLKAIKERKTFALKGKGIKLGIWAKTLYESRLRYLFKFKSKISPYE